MRALFLLPLLIACEDDVASDTENAAERVTSAQSDLRRERRDLDDLATNPARAYRNADVSDETADVTRGVGELAQAQRDFAYLKMMRVQSLRAEHSVIASQPMLIHIIANDLHELSPAQRRRVNENLVIFRERLADTRELIEDLQYVQAADWEREDDEVARAMAGLFVARDASWQSIEGGPDDEDFPST